jgi:hypothetical protein
MKNDEYLARRSTVSVSKAGGMKNEQLGMSYTYALYLIPYTRIPYTLYLIPYTLYLIPYTLHCTQHHSPPSGGWGVWTYGFPGTPHPHLGMGSFSLTSILAAFEFSTAIRVPHSI